MKQLLIVFLFFNLTVNAQDYKPHVGPTKFTQINAVSLTMAETFDFYVEISKEFINASERTYLDQRRLSLSKEWSFMRGSEACNLVIYYDKDDEPFEVFVFRWRDKTVIRHHTL